MKSYDSFAVVYDKLTENVDYKVRSEYISGFFNKYNIKNDALILDLACGTGSISLELSNLGFTVIAVDSSSEMLSIADSKLSGKASLICAEMQDFTLPEPADACVCLLDSLNHLENRADLKKTFENIYKSLKPEGILIFDVNTPYKHNCVLADNTFVFDEDGYFLSWDNEDLGNNRIRILIDLFIQCGDYYQRFSEDFIETAYEYDALEEVVSDYFDILGVYDELTDKPPHSESERVFYVCRRK